MELVIIVLIASIVLVVLWAWSVQNSLIGVDEACSNALSQIGVQQESRWDALTQLNSMTKSYAQHEYNTIQAAINARQHMSNGPISPEELVAQEHKFEQAFGRVMMVVEAYPMLKASEVFLMNMEYLKNYEDQVKYTRLMYNDLVSKYNRETRMIPTCFIAGFIGFKKRKYLDISSIEKINMPTF